MDAARHRKVKRAVGFHFSHVSPVDILLSYRNLRIRARRD